MLYTVKNLPRSKNIPIELSPLTMASIMISTKTTLAVIVDLPSLKPCCSLYRLLVLKKSTNRRYKARSYILENVGK